MSINIIFYSNNCDASKLLLSMMDKENLLRFFHKICTDNNPKIPPQIRMTPTIIIKGVPTPYEGSEAFSWFSRIKQWKINVMLQKMNQNQQQYIQSMNNNLVGDNVNVLGFNNIEMNGMSDIFSFFARDPQQECQDSLPQSYFSVQNIGTENIFTPPLENGSYRVNSSVKLNENKQKELLEKTKIERKKQEDEFIKHIDNFKRQCSNL